MTHDKTEEIEVTCHRGHTSPRATWDCPVCVNKMRAELASLRKELEEAREVLRLAREQRTRLEIADEELARARSQLRTVWDAHANADDALERVEAQGERQRDELASLRKELEEAREVLQDVRGTLRRLRKTSPDPFNGEGPWRSLSQRDAMRQLYEDERTIAAALLSHPTPVPRGALTHHYPLTTTKD